MRLAFLGSPEVAVTTLRALVDAGHDVCAVVTQPDARRGRGAHVSPTPVATVAHELDIAVTHSPADLLALDPRPDLGIVVAFGQLVRPAVLAHVPMLNLHFSLLPRWRGAAPVERALLAGDAVTGVCVMGVEQGLDTGPVYTRVELPIRSDHTATSLRQELAEAGTAALLGLLERLPLPEPVAQRGEPTYAAKITSEDRRLSAAMAATQLDRVVRVGGAWCLTDRGRLKVNEATVQPAAALRAPVAPGSIDRREGAVVLAGADSSEFVVRLDTVAPEGKSVMAATAWWAGVRGGPVRLV